MAPKPKILLPGQVALILHFMVKWLFHAFSLSPPLSRHLELLLENGYTAFSSVY